MDGKTFKLTKIEGEYAYLSPIDGGEDIFIAMALLPVGADIGTLLTCESFQFTILEQLHHYLSLAAKLYYPTNLNLETE